MTANGIPGERLQLRREISSTATRNAARREQSVCKGTGSIGWAVLSVLRCLSDQQHPGSEIWECFEFLGGLFHIRFDQAHGNEPSGIVIVSAAAVTDEAIQIQFEMVITEDRPSVSACARIRTTDLFGRAKQHRSQASYFHDYPPLRGRDVLLRLLACSFIRDEFLKLVLLFLPHFLELLPLTLREDRSYLFVRRPYHLLKGVQLFLA